MCGGEGAIWLKAPKSFSAKIRVFQKLWNFYPKALRKGFTSELNVKYLFTVDVLNTQCERKSSGWTCQTMTTFLLPPKLEDIFELSFI